MSTPVVFLEFKDPTTLKYEFSIENFKEFFKESTYNFNVPGQLADLA